MTNYQILLIAFIFLSIQSCDRQPELKNPKAFQIGNISFEYPNNWYEGEHGEDDKIGFKWTNIKSPKNAIFSIQHYNKQYEYKLDDFVNNYLERASDKMNNNLIETEVKDNIQPINLSIMNKAVEAIQIEYQNKVLGVTINQQSIFFLHTTDHSTNLFIATTNSDDWEIEKAGFDLIIESLQIK